MNIPRILKLPDSQRSIFLWGPRKTGKSCWIQSQVNNSWTINLLESDTFLEFAARPALLRERFAKLEARPEWVVIDEVQKLPLLLDEVHWLIENADARFLLTGSSARKLRRGQANLLGGRAWRREMRPFCLAELASHPWELESLCRSGLIPPHYLADEPHEDLAAYVGDYLKEEIAAEASAQSLPVFAEFLRVAALTNGEIMNFTNLSREVGTSARVVRSYFEILEDTLLGERLPAYRKGVTRRLLQTDKFYLFDVGLANFLCRRKPSQGTPEFGKSFEHFVWMEIQAWKAYKQRDLELSYWRTTSGFEVDFIFNDREVAVEVKSGRVHETDLKGLTALADDGPVAERMLVSLDGQPRSLRDRHGTVSVLPLRDFVQWLWNR